MTRIRVNPEALIQKSADLTTIAVHLRDISDEVKNAVGSAPGYDGQFAPLVSTIGWTAVTACNKNSTSLADHSSDLVKRASAFLAADAVGVLGLGKHPPLPLVIYDPFYLKRLSAYGISLAALLRLRNLGRLPIINVTETGMHIGLLQLKTIWDRVSNWILGIVDRVTGDIGPDGVMDEKELVIVGGVEIIGVPIIQNENARISRGYNQHIADTGSHSIDIAVTNGVGTPINASFVGKVVFSSDKGMKNFAPEPEGGWNKLAHNYGLGNVMIVEYAYDDQPIEIQQIWQEQYGMKPGQSIYASYGHLNTSSLLSPGTIVQPGDKIAELGSSGHSTGPHVHLTLMVHESNSINNDSNWSLAGFNQWKSYANPEKVGQFLPNTTELTHEYSQQYYE